MYTLLEGVRVLELALLAPDLLGMHLADLGAEVIKIEQPPGGDYVREIGGRKLGGLSLLHLRWNRGKKSLLLDLKQQEGRELLGELAARSDVFLDGLRAGAAARCGADYETLRARNPALVYCSLSGTGQFGPYSKLATHGVAYDAYAGLAPPAEHPDGSPRIPAHTAVGMYAAPLYAAAAVCAALLSARRTGVGARLDVAEMDAAASWRAEAIDAALNHADVEYPDMTASVRYQYYWASDGGAILFQASERKFWERFCRGVGRLDLFESRPGGEVGDHARGDEALRKELAAIFRTRTRAEWVAFFLEHDVPGGPVYAPGEVAEDPHFRARELLFEQRHPTAGPARFVGSPVKLAGARFAAAPAPDPGAHSEEVLRSVLGLDADRIRALRASGVVPGGAGGGTG